MIIFAYFGPETTLPLASTAVAVLGVVLAAGRVAACWLAQRFRSPGRG